MAIARSLALCGRDDIVRWRILAMDGPITAPDVIRGEASTAVTPPLARVPLVLNKRNFDWITNRISGVVEESDPALVVGRLCHYLGDRRLFGLTCIGYQISTGVGVWGLNPPVGWAWDITNFVFWIGIGHAGTLISAILFLLRQKWRTSINRAAEAMTLFAVICAAIFPGIHVGRVWMAWFLAPVPNAVRHLAELPQPAALGRLRGLDLFHGLGALLVHRPGSRSGTLRDRATSKIKKFLYGIFALGWRGSNRHWRHYEMAYLLLAGLSTPLVLSVHSVVSFDFATSIIPSWHTTIFPPYFVAGAIFGGFAMVLTLMIPARAIYQTAGHHHAAAHRQDGEDHSAHRLDRWLRLR